MEGKLVRNSEHDAIRFARKLRQDMTEAEKKLWRGLRRHGLRFHFRRQCPVGDYVLDFFCTEAMVCVELDGESHVGRGDRDARRDEVVASLGILTLRFPNTAVDEDLFGFWIELGRFARGGFVRSSGRTGRPPWIDPPVR